MKTRTFLVFIISALMSFGAISSSGCSSDEEPVAPMPPSTATSTPSATSTPQPQTHTSTTTPPTATYTATPILRTPTPAIAPTATPIPSPTPEPTPTPSPTSVPKRTTSGLTEPQLANAREYALKLINDARTAEGLNPVTLDDNPAAQSHAEDMLRTCFSGHWGSDGSKPYMRYTLAGGEQYSAENISGIDFCPPDPDRYATKLIRAEINEATDGLLDSPGHRRNILNPHHRKVNIGISYQRPNLWLVQLFVGDYIRFTTKPIIEHGILTLTGTVTNEVSLEGEDALGVQIFLDPPMRRLTRGQLSRTYCVGSGTQIASLRSPLDPGWFYDDDIATKSVDRAPCPDPYKIDSGLPPPASYDEADQVWQQAYDASQAVVSRQITYPWITANDWSIDGQNFEVSANISDLLDQHGNGVYTIVLWGEIDGEDVPISRYSIFVPLLPDSQATVPARSTATPKPQPIQTPIGTPIPTAANAPTGSNESDLDEARQYALARINQTRTASGLDPLTLDENTAVQSHAADMRTNCFLSHWGTDGLKSYMRYTLAGGQQYSSVYLSGSDYCPHDPEKYRHRTIQEELNDLMDRLLVDPDYLDEALDPNHRQVSFGIADQQPNFWFVQRFVGDFIEYFELPNINNQILSLSGLTKNGARLSGDSFGISIDYDQTPHALTRGQLHHTSCGANGVRIGALREPLEASRYYTSDTFTLSGTRCQDPYYVPADAPVAASYDDEVPRIRNPYENEAIWITATHWEVTDETFSVTADIGDLLTQHGNGVYTVVVWAQINGEDTPISEYSIFIPSHP